MSEYEKAMLKKQEKLIVAVNDLCNEVALSNDIRALELNVHKLDVEELATLLVQTIEERRGKGNA